MFTKIALTALAAFLLFSAVSAQAGIRYGDFPPPPRVFASNAAIQGR
jgi:hypothetical protein